MWNKKGAGKGAAGPAEETLTQMLETVIVENNPQHASDGVPESHEEKDGGMEWYFHTAGFIKMLTPRLVNSLVKGGDVTKHYIEWCKTPES